MLGGLPSLEGLQPLLVAGDDDPPSPGPLHLCHLGPVGDLRGGAVNVDLRVSGGVARKQAQSGLVRETTIFR